MGSLAYVEPLPLSSSLSLSSSLLLPLSPCLFHLIADELPCNVTVQYLVERRNCRLTCIMRNDDNCPSCDRDCNSKSAASPLPPHPRIPSSIPPPSSALLPPYTTHTHTHTPSHTQHTHSHTHHHTHNTHTHTTHTLTYTFTCTQYIQTHHHTHTTTHTKKYFLHISHNEVACCAKKIIFFIFCTASNFIMRYMQKYFLDFK